MEFIGLDGCPVGWFYFGLSGSGKAAYGIARNANEVAALADAAQLALIDIPIGLHDSGTAERLCDKEAPPSLALPPLARGRGEMN